MLEAVEAAAEGLSEVASLISPDGCERTSVGGNQWHNMKLVLCVRSTSEFDTVYNVFNRLKEFVPI